MYKQKCKYGSFSFEERDIMSCATPLAFSKCAKGLEVYYGNNLAQIVNNIKQGITGLLVDVADNDLEQPNVYPYTVLVCGYESSYALVLPKIQVNTQLETVNLIDVVEPYQDICIPTDLKDISGYISKIDKENKTVTLNNVLVPIGGIEVTRGKFE